MTPKNEPPAAPVDLKAGLGNKKPPVGYVTPAMDNYVARASQFGGEKYAVPGNYLRPSPDGDDAERLFQYACAARRHLGKLCLSLIRFKAGGKGAAATVQEAAYAADLDDGAIASNLPSLCGAAASINIMIQQAVDAGLLPADPGITWDRAALAEFRKGSK